jgi:RNA polymerase sigma-70 factor (ECF subfamily)
MMGLVPGDELQAYVEAALEGDQVALAHLVRRTQPQVWQMCNALGSPGEEADLVQETYTRMLRALPSYRGEARFSVWLLSIARRVCADHVRRRERGRRLLERVVSTEVARAMLIDEPVDDLLAEIDDSRREAFVLTQMVGLSYEEAADVIGCPIGTIRSRVARAREDLLDAVRRRDVG